MAQGLDLLAAGSTGERQSGTTSRGSGLRWEKVKLRFNTPNKFLST